MCYLDLLDGLEVCTFSHSREVFLCLSRSSCNVSSGARPNAAHISWPGCAHVLFHINPSWFGLIVAFNSQDESQC